MADTKKREEDEDQPTVVAGDSKTGQYQKFPANPSTWDYVKESFQPTQTRAMLEAVRNRRQKAYGG